MYRLLHFADLHLEASFASEGLPPAIGNRRRDQLRGTLARILALARERAVDAVTIGGDLYEQEYVLPEASEFLAQQFARLAPIRVFIAPGDRDPYTADSLYASTRWPTNVTIFDQGRPTSVQLADSIHLWGAAHPLARGQSVLAGLRSPANAVNLLLVHADPPDNPDPAASALQAARIDLALLGGSHSSDLSPENPPYRVQPGSPEPLARHEAGPGHGVAIVTIHEGACAVERLPIGRWRYLSLKADLSACRTPEHAVQSITRTLQATSGADDELVDCEIALTGTPAFELDLAALHEGLSARAYVHFTRRFDSPYDLDALAAEATVRGTLVRRFQALLKTAGEGSGRKTALDALHCALRALDGKAVQPDETH